jgi:plasmid stability protein
MPDIIIRDLRGDVLKRLKRAAQLNGRSLEAQIRAVLQQWRDLDAIRIRRVSARWIAKLEKGQHSDSTALIRDDRDSR